MHGAYFYPAQSLAASWARLGSRAAAFRYLAQRAASIFASTIHLPWNVSLSTNITQRYQISQHVAPRQGQQSDMHDMRMAIRGTVPMFYCTMRMFPRSSRCATPPSRRIRFSAALVAASWYCMIDDLARR
jgi:hypothetical protein